jgi:hypothetical protein
VIEGGGMYHKNICGSIGNGIREHTPLSLFEIVKKIKIPDSPNTKRDAGLE